MKYIKSICIIILLTISACSYYEEHPQVKSVSPANNEQDVDSSTAITINFTKEMNTTMTIEEFSLEYGSSTIEGTFAWQNGNKTLVFQPFETLDQPGAYTIRISKYAEDTNGNDLEDDFKSVFYISTDITAPEVTSHTPANKATGVLPGDIITITFSEAVDLDSIYEYGSISVSPSIDGIFSWNTDHTTITFAPGEDMSYGTKYTVTVGETIQDTNGNALKEQYSFSFTVGDDTTAPSISSVYQMQTPLPSVTLSESTTITTVEKFTLGTAITNADFIIEFSELIDTSTIESAISFSPSVNYYLLTETAGTTTRARIVLTEALTSGETYYVSISDSITDIQNNSLDKSYDYSFTVSGTYSQVPQVTSVNDPTESVGNQEWDLSTGAVQTLNMGGGFTHQNIRITFSAGIDPSSFSISISKIVGTGSTGITNASWPAQNIFEFDLVAGYAAGDIYKLIIDGGSDGIQDIYGNYISEDYERIFQF